MPMHTTNLFWGCAHKTILIFFKIHKCTYPTGPFTCMSCLSLLTQSFHVQATQHAVGHVGDHGLGAPLVH